jgi:hypothetical protein
MPLRRKYVSEFVQVGFFFVLCFSHDGMLGGVADPACDAEGGGLLDGFDAEKDACPVSRGMGEN